MKATQWLGVLLLFLIVGGVFYAYLRKGTAIKPDDTRKIDDWPTTLGDPGGS